MNATTPANLLYTLRTTGRTRKSTPEYGAAIELPEVQISQGHECSELAYYDGVCELDGKFYYLVEEQYARDESGMANAYYLVEQQYGQDYGGNTHNARTAPETTQGLCYSGRGQVAFRKSHSEPLFAVVPPELPRLIRERAERAARKAKQDAVLAEFRTARDTWQTAWDAAKLAGVPFGADCPENQLVRTTAYRMHAAEKECQKYGPDWYKL